MRLSSMYIQATAHYIFYSDISLRLPIRMTGTVPKVAVNGGFPFKIRGLAIK